MKTTTEALRDLLTSSDAAQRVFDAGLKVTILLAAVLIAAAVLHRVFRMSAARRASVFLLGAIAVPVIVVASLAGGERELVWWSLPGEPASSIKTEVVSAQAEVQEGWVRALFSTVVEGIRENAAAGGEVSVKEVTKPVPLPSPIRWDLWALGVWIAGMVGIALHLVLGIWVLNRRLQRRADRVEGGALADALQRTASQIGLRRMPELWLARDPSVMPMTWGAVQHRVVLPAGAATWAPARLAIVLRHELGHVQRRDCLAGWAVRLLLAPVWFHPLAWLATRAGADLRERACDDLATNADTAETYARELVAISRDHQPPAGALAMARPKRLEARIRALFCPKIGRGGTGKAFRGVTLAAVVAVTLPMCFISACQTAKIEPVPSAPSSKAANSPWTKSPKPTVRKGEQKVIAQIYEVSSVGADTSHIDPAEYRPVQEALRAKGHGEIPAATFAKMHRWKGVDILTLPAFPAGKRQEISVGRNVPYLEDTDEEDVHQVEHEHVGLTTRALVRKLPSGKLSIDLDLEFNEIVGEEVTPDGNKKPVFSTRIVEVPHQVIANGAGFPVMIREDIQSAEDKVPILGDIPIAGRLFREQATYTIKFHILVSFRVEAP